MTSRIAVPCRAVVACPMTFRRATRRSHAVCAALLLLSVCGCSLLSPSTSRRTELVFGTPCTVTVFERGGEKVIDSVFEEMRRLDSIMNVHDEASQASRINRQAGGEAQSVDPELYQVIETGIAFARISGGAFDISIGPLVSLWNITGESPRPPSAAAIAEARDLVEYSDILLLEYRRQVLLKRAGMRIDLGGIAKGYAADRAADVIEDSGVSRALIDFGGNIYAVGEKAGGEAWRIGIQNPFEPRGTFIGVLLVRDTSVVSSGVYERFYEYEGKRYHHILDPDTGVPVSNGLAGVTIIAASSMTADALATAVFVLGLEAGLTLVDNFEGIEAIVITDSREAYFTSGALAAYVAADDSFAIYEWTRGR
jgi:FAD:protein FMN transferase